MDTRSEIFVLLHLSVPFFSLQEFVRRNGQFSVNIGLCHHSFPVLGVVCVPSKSSFARDCGPRVYYALDGQGAFVRPLGESLSTTSVIETEGELEGEPESRLSAPSPRRLECKEFFETDQHLRIVMSSLSGAVSPLRASSLHLSSSPSSSAPITPESFLSRFKSPVIVSTSGSSIFHRSDSGLTPLQSDSSPINSADSSTSSASLTSSLSSGLTKPSTLSIPSYSLSSQLGSQSLVLNLLLLAEGKADCYPRLSLSCEWNTCAAHAILNEAGGEIVQLANGMDSSSQCVPGEQVMYNKPHPIHPHFVAYGKRLIPSHLLLGGHRLDSSSPSGGDDGGGSVDLPVMLAIQAKQQELKRLLDLQDLQFEQSSSLLQDSDQKLSGDGDDGKTKEEGGADLEEEELEHEEPTEVLGLSQPQTLSLSLGLLGIFLAVAICCLAILYQIQHKPIN
jgi:3'-phosphoadenosine 5'-phosphosulfate (PAPS) 3'-phosphatase